MDEIVERVENNFINIYNKFDILDKKINNYHMKFHKINEMSIKYLLDKLYNNDSVPKELFNHFNSSLTALKEKSKKIPVEYIDDQVIIKGGETANNDIKISNKDLD